jgi:hypothetical protein
MTVAVPLMLMMLIGMPSQPIRPNTLPPLTGFAGGAIAACLKGDLIV